VRGADVDVLRPAAVGADVLLHTHLVVREDAQLLYAFATEQERRLFRSLLKVSGVGPRIALGILSGINVDGFMLCIEAQDPEPLVRIPGVGRKTAERLLIEMRDRVKDFGLPGGGVVAASRRRGRLRPAGSVQCAGRARATSRRRS
jgi:holliday junction DNA helicase RuvA